MVRRPPDSPVDPTTLRGKKLFLKKLAGADSMLTERGTITRATDASIWVSSGRNDERYHLGSDGYSTRVGNSAGWRTIDTYVIEGTPAWATAVAEVNAALDRATRERLRAEARQRIENRLYKADLGMLEAIEKAIDALVEGA